MHQYAIKAVTFSITITYLEINIYDIALNPMFLNLNLSNKYLIAVSIFFISMSLITIEQTFIEIQHCCNIDVMVA